MAAHFNVGIRRQLSHHICIRYAVNIEAVAVFLRDVQDSLPDYLLPCLKIIFVATSVTAISPASHNLAIPNIEIYKIENTIKMRQASAVSRHKIK
jgi:hypothetical protein